MKRNWIIFLAGFILAAAPAVASALELKDYAVGDDTKKITLSFTFSAAVKDADFEVVNNYQGNFVALKLKGLVFTKKQLKADVPAKKGLVQFYRFIRFTPGEGSGEVRLYLAKPVTPADVLTELRDAKATLEIVKPWWKLPGAKPPEEEAGTQPDFIPDSKPAAGDPAPAEEQPISSGELPPPGGGFRDVGGQDAAAPPAAAEDTAVQPAGGDDAAPGPGGAEPEESAEAEPAVDNTGGARTSQGEVYNQTGVGEVFGHNGSGYSGTKPAREPKPAGQDSGRQSQPQTPRGNRGYTEFDLDQIPITGIEIRGLPFDEALMKLVASSGFNVVVGKDVDSTEVNLNFTQKQITLKSALDLLCIAYDLSYSIEADAIVIKGKP